MKLSKVELEAEQLLKQTLGGGTCLPRGLIEAVTWLKITL